MKKLAIAAAVALMVSGCAHQPQPSQPQVNRTMKADKYAAPKKPVVEAVTPNEIVQKRWYDRFLKHKSK